MTIKSSGSSLSFSEIEAEFGSNGGRTLGNYRLTQSVGSLSNLPLDSGIPTSGQIKFSDFYGKRLNVVVDCHSGSRQDRISAKGDKWNNNAVTVIGGFRSKKEGGSKIIINVNKKFCSDKSNTQNCALRTGNWNSTSTVQVDLGSNANILGGGGDGGDGTSALGIQVNNCVVNVGSGAILRAGFGGGGGGGGGQQTDKGSDRRASGGGGGGGAGCPAGSGGQGGSVQSGDGDSGGNPGSAGTESSGGSPGGGGDNDDQAGGQSGGSGGDAQGNAGGGGNGNTSGGSGGSNGAAIRRTSGFNVTINNSGTIAGSTSATGVS